MGLGCTLAAALTDVPTPDNFQRRVWATATLLGDYVYIDGGDLDQLADGEGSGTYPGEYGATEREGVESGLAKQLTPLGLQSTPRFPST